MVSDEAITRVLAAASPASVWNGRATLHCLPNSYSIDAAKGIHDPRKMLARRLGVDVVVVSVDAVVARDGPAFAIATGLLIYPQAAHLEHFGRKRHLMTGTSGYFGQVAVWLREGFL